MRKLRCISALLIVLALPMTALAQQQATITGKVQSGSGVPLQSVSVFVQGMNLGTITTADGSYTLVVPAARFRSGQSVQLIAQLIGYRAESHTIQLVGGGIRENFELALDPLRLSEIVATGSGTQARRERLGTSVASVSATAVARTNESNVVTALAGKVPNVITNQQSGEAGASTAIQIRGYKTLGSSQPLIVVDGVPTNNATRMTGSSVLQGGVAPNRASDINPEDIESIEILKGAAATSIYGAAAGSAGAILITTKRGKPGRTSYTLRSSYQADKPVRTLPLQNKYGIGTNGVASSCGTTVNCLLNSGFQSWGPKLADGTVTYDHSKELYETGSIFDNSVTMSGGSERTTFYLSLGATMQNGFIVGNKDKYNRYSVRFNGSHQLANALTISASGTYAPTRGSFIERGNSVNGLLLGALRTPPDWNNKIYLDPVTGTHRTFRFPNPSATAFTNSRGFDNPFYSIYENENTAQTGRYFGNVNANWKPFEWLQVNYTMGGDFTSDDRVEAFGQQTSGTSGGSVEHWQFFDRILDSNLTATGSWQVTKKINSTVTVGQNLNETYFRQVDALGRTLIAPKPFKMSNTVTPNPTGDSESRRRLRGYFVQATSDIDDQLFLQARIRNDASSAFGVNNNNAWYPGGSVSWSFTKAVHLPEDIVTFGKARLAYGQSGQQPPLYALQDIFGGSTSSFSDFNPGAIVKPTLNGIGGLFSSAQKGNPDIKPERVGELESGFDLSLFKAKADFSLTYYSSHSKDVVIGMSLPPSTGFTSQIQNAAEIRNKGWEATAGYRPIQGKDFSLEIGANWARNRNVVISLGNPAATKETCTELAILPQCQVGFSSSFTGQTTNVQVGYPMGIWRGADFARCGRGLKTITVSGVAYDIAAACAGAPDGALFIGNNGFPILDGNTRIIGNPEPNWTGGVSFTATIKGVEVSAFVDHRHGGDVDNMTRSSLYQYGTHKDTEIRGNSYTFGKDFPCVGKICKIYNGPVVGPGANQAVVVGEGWFSGGTLGNGLGGNAGPPSNHMEDGTNTRLREVSLGYTFKQAWVSKIGGASQMDVKVSGRNLGLWTDYTGYDPETNLAGAAGANRGIDWFNNPLDRALIISVALHH